MAGSELKDAPAAAPSELMDERTRVLALSVEQYHRMIEEAILPESEPYELLAGQIIRKDRSARGEDPITVGQEHMWVVKALAELGPRLKPFGCHMHSQQPVALPPFDEPEPDGAIIRGTLDDYRHRKPGPNDILCVIEVADASLRRDRTTKLGIYARAGIESYLIINLPERVVESYTRPTTDGGRYERCETLGAEQSVKLSTAGDAPLSVPIHALLP